MKLKSKFFLSITQLTKISRYAYRECISQNKQIIFDTNIIIFWDVYLGRVILQTT
jgi:hypothetical protein